MANPQQQLGEIVATHRVTRDCLVLLGWSTEDLAGEGVAALETRRSDKGRFRAASWIINETGDRQRWFVAAANVPGVGEARSGDLLRLHSAVVRTPTVACLPLATTDGAAFADMLRLRLGRHMMDAVRFFVGVFSNKASRRLESVGSFLAAILYVAAEEDGVVEIVGPVDGEGLLLQGWSRQRWTPDSRLLVHGEILEEHAAVQGVFARPDLEAPASGFVALLRPASTGIQLAPRQIYFVAGDRLCRIGVLPNAKRLSVDEAPNHLRDMLPNLRVDGVSERAFRIAARPRFSGQDTVSNGERPVRMAVDVAARIPDVGWYFTGWLLDPLALVSAVMLRGHGGLAERLDTQWTRIARQDVSAGYRGDARFEGRIVDDAHGFTVYVPHRGEAQRAWLELELAGGDCAFMPLTTTTVDGPDERRRLLQSFDIHKASAIEIVDRHLGPLFHAAGSTSSRLADHRIKRTASVIRDVAIIVPMVDPELRTNIVVAGLARRRMGGVGTPIFVCAPALADKSERLLAELDFYGLDASVVLAEQAIDLCDALQIGTRATDAARFLFLSPRVHGMTSDWAARLLVALGDDKAPAVVSPTLLYEDWSIRFAGFDSIRFLDVAPYVDAAATRAGYPRDWAGTAAPSPTLAGSIDCCAMTRAAFDCVAGFSAGYALAELRGLDLFLRMRAAGVPIHWVSGVELYAIEDAVAADDYVSRTGEMVDGWSFRATWKGRLPAVVGPSAEAAVVDELEVASPSAASAVPSRQSMAEARTLRQSGAAGR